LAASPAVRFVTVFPLALALAACGGSDPAAGGWTKEKRPEVALPVRAERPARGSVADIVETQAALETDHHASIYAEVDGVGVGPACAALARATTQARANGSRRVDFFPIMTTPCGICGWGTCCLKTRRPIAFVRPISLVGLSV